MTPERRYKTKICLVGDSAVGKTSLIKKYVLDSIPMGKMAAAEDVAYATLFLASDFADMITGHILVVDGGWTIQ